MSVILWLARPLEGQVDICQLWWPESSQVRTCNARHMAGLLILWLAWHFTLFHVSCLNIYYTLLQERGWDRPTWENIGTLLFLGRIEVNRLVCSQDYCQNRFLRWTPMKAEEGGGAYASLRTRQGDGRFEDVGLSVCASPLQILVLGFRRTEFWRSAVGLKVSGGIRETEEMEEFVGSIQCNIWTEELPPQHAQYLYCTAEM